MHSQVLPRTTVFALLLPALLLPACVTVNIYFPAAAAEKAADRIIDEVWKENRQREAVPEESSQSSFTQPWRQRLTATAHRWLDRIVPAAQAQQVNLQVSDPAIDAIKARMAGRHAALKPYFDRGAVGLTRDALIAVRDLGATPLRSRIVMKKLVADENADRDALYREIANVNGQPDWEQQIRATFAERWVAKAAKGWWYQDEAGQWKQR